MQRLQLHFHRIEPMKTSSSIVGKYPETGSEREAERVTKTDGDRQRKTHGAIEAEIRDTRDRQIEILK